MTRPPHAMPQNTPQAPKPDVPPTPQRYCRTCRFYSAAEVVTSIGRVTMRACTQRSSPYFMTLPGPHGQCDQYHGGPLEDKIE